MIYKNKKTFLHSGDLGDIIAAMPIIRDLGGGTLLCCDREGTKALVERIHLIKPLLEYQPYIKSVQAWNGGGHVDYDFTPFRRLYGIGQGHGTLGEIQARHFNIQYHGKEPWLKAPISDSDKEYYLCCRSPRHHNDKFPWKQIVQRYGPSLFFMGLPEEHQDFCKNFGSVRYLPVKDYLEAATYLTGCKCFFTNQTSLYWVAEGLKIPIVQERWNLDSTFDRECFLGIDDSDFGKIERFIASMQERQ